MTASRVRVLMFPERIRGRFCAMASKTTGAPCDLVRAIAGFTATSTDATQHNQLRDSQVNAKAAHHLLWAPERAGTRRNTLPGTTYISGTHDTSRVACRRASTLDSAFWLAAERAAGLVETRQSRRVQVAQIINFVQDKKCAGHGMRKLIFFQHRRGKRPHGPNGRDLESLKIRTRTNRRHSFSEPYSCRNSAVSDAAMRRRKRKSAPLSDHVVEAISRPGRQVRDPSRQSILATASEESHNNCRHNQGESEPSR